MDDSTHYKLLKTLEANPELSQRQLAHKLGISLGKVNYCLQALIERGSVKAENFRTNPRKTRYLYVLTPNGIEEKARVTSRFLKKKLREYKKLKKEIEILRTEMEK